MYPIEAKSCKYIQSKRRLEHIFTSSLLLWYLPVSPEPNGFIGLKWCSPTVSPLAWIYKGDYSNQNRMTETK